MGERGIEGVLRRCLAEITHDAKTVERIGPEDNLFELGILDSMGVVQVVTFLETHFGIRMSEDELASPEFTCVRGLVGIVLRHQNANAGASRARAVGLEGGSDGAGV